MKTKMKVVITFPLNRELNRAEKLVFGKFFKEDYKKELFTGDNLQAVLEKLNSFLGIVSTSPKVEIVIIFGDIAYEQSIFALLGRRFAKMIEANCNVRVIGDKCIIAHQLTKHGEDAVNLSPDQLAT